LPDGIACGLVGSVGKLVGAVDALTDGFGGLEALKDGVEDETNFRLRRGVWDKKRKSDQRTAKA
jgi:hypothetical protein